MLKQTSLTAADIMTKRVITLHPEDDLFEVMSLFVRNKISGAPVVDQNGKYLGVFTERTSIKLLIDAAQRGTPTNQIAKFVDSDAVTVSPHTGLLSIAQMLMTTEYRRLPVLDHGRVIGLISRRDVLKAAHASMEPEVSHDSGILYLSSTRDRGDMPIT